jgi:hypothetical protein
VKPKITWRAAALVLVFTVTTAAVLAELRATVASRTLDAPSKVLPAAANGDVRSSTMEGRPATGFVVTQGDDSARKEITYGVRQAKAPARAAFLEISFEPSQVKSDDHFAEIRLHRNVLQNKSSFTWWTEPATAKPGVDYVPEAVAIQTFPAGYRTMRLYVRLLPQSLRSQRSYFYVAIAQVHSAPAPGPAAASVIRLKVWLPMTSNLQARR